MLIPPWCLCAGCSLRCLPDPGGPSESRHPSLWDLGHGRSGEIPQRDPTLLQRSSRCAAGLRHQQKGKRNRHLNTETTSLILYYYIIVLCVFVLVGNIYQSSGLAQRAPDTLHSRIDGHMAGGQQGRSGRGSTSLSTGTKTKSASLTSVNTVTFTVVLIYDMQTLVSFYHRAGRTESGRWEGITLHRDISAVRGTNQWAASGCR